MNLKTIFQATAVTAALTISSFAAEGWMTNFEEAKKKAAAEKKDLLVDFTGSDWCGWCIRLDKEVFQKAGFKGSEKFILVSLDFPRDKSKVTPEIQKQNAALQKKFGVRGFPTILLMDSKGQPYAKTGYKAGGPEAYNKHLAELGQLRVKRDASFAAAAKLEGPEKAKALVAALKSLEGVSPTAYEGVLQDILKADPTDADGFVGGALLSSTIAKVKDAASAKVAFDAIDAQAAKTKLTGMKKQEFLTQKLDVLYGLKDIAGMAAVMDQIIAIDPESQIGKGLKQFKETRYKKMLEQSKPKTPAAK